MTTTSMNVCDRPAISAYVRSAVDDALSTTKDYKQGVTLISLASEVDAAMLWAVLTHTGVLEDLRHELGLTTLAAISPSGSKDAAALIGAELPEPAQKWEQVVVLMIGVDD